VEDILPRESTIALFQEVHQRFLRSVKSEIRRRKIQNPKSSKARILLFELTFYGQSLLQLNVVPEELLKTENFEEIWKNL
jgi:hypothetical protein